jgi:hypothetical protein
MNKPNVILKGCIKSQEAIEFTKTYLGVRFQSEEKGRIVEIPVQGKKTLKVIRWSWGVQIGCHPYRTMNTSWWDSLLSTFASSCMNAENRFVIILHCIDSLSAENQRVIRRHTEDDFMNTRFILTCRDTSVLDPSLESRCVSFIRGEPTDENTDLPVMKKWKDVLDIWLTDLPAIHILDTMFESKPLTEERIRLWCWYSDALKKCYHETTVLECVWKELNQTSTS